MRPLDWHDDCVASAGFRFSTSPPLALRHQHFLQLVGLHYLLRRYFFHVLLRSDDGGHSLQGFHRVLRVGGVRGGRGDDAQKRRVPLEGLPQHPGQEAAPVRNEGVGLLQDLAPGADAVLEGPERVVDLGALLLARLVVVQAVVTPLTSRAVDECEYAPPLLSPVSFAQQGDLQDSVGSGARAVHVRRLRRPAALAHGNVLEHLLRRGNLEFRGSFPLHRDHGPVVPAVLGDPELRWIHAQAGAVVLVHPQHVGVLAGQLRHGHRSGVARGHLDQDVASLVSTHRERLLHFYHLLHPEILKVGPYPASGQIAQVVYKQE
mmetsp:Transcript_2964/g.5524  ORF Transcript_2964/g.5524 Transcript_2964/m.5524 type:complete len:319 (-) Transcript_2964:29-985(-)